VCRVPGQHETTTLKRLCGVCQIYLTIFPLNGRCVLGLRDTIALKYLLAVSQIFVTIFPLTSLGPVCQVYMTQLP